MPADKLEIVADFVLGVFALNDAPNLHDSGQDCFLLEDVLMRPEPSFTEDKFQLLRHADESKQSLLEDAVCQPREIAHVLSVASSEFDLGYVEGFEHGSLSS